MTDAHPECLWRRPAAATIMIGALALAVGGVCWREYRFQCAREFTEASLIQLYYEGAANAELTPEDFWIVKTGRLFQIHLMRIRECVPRQAAVLVVTPWQNFAFETKSHYWLYPRRVSMLTTDDLQGALPEDGEADYIAYFGRTAVLRECRNLTAFEPACPPAYSGAPHAGEGVSAILRRR